MLAYAAAFLVLAAPRATPAKAPRAAAQPSTVEVLGSKVELPAAAGAWTAAGDPARPREVVLTAAGKKPVTLRLTAQLDQTSCAGWQEAVGADLEPSPWVAAPWVSAAPKEPGPVACLETGLGLVTAAVTGEAARAAPVLEALAAPLQALKDVPREPGTPGPGTVELPRAQLGFQLPVGSDLRWYVRGEHPLAREAREAGQEFPRGEEVLLAAVDGQAVLRSRMSVLVVAHPSCERLAGRDPRREDGRWTTWTASGGALGACAQLRGGRVLFVNHYVDAPLLRLRAAPLVKALLAAAEARYGATVAGVNEYLSLPKSRLKARIPAGWVLLPDHGGENVDVFMHRSRPLYLTVERLEKVGCDVLEAHLTSKGWHPTIGALDRSDGGMDQRLVCGTTTTRTSRFIVVVRGPGLLADQELQGVAFTDTRSVTDAAY